ncbi:MAG: hypothetical protein ACK5QC_00540 [Bacteroidota bacterium]|nr:hypothetical protein [Bacteroidota bacterium]
MAHVFKGNGSNTFDYIKLKKSGDIYYNNRKMAFNNVAKSYFDSTGSLTQEPVVWALTNSDSLPTINYTTNIGYPMNNSTIILPNTISKSNDLVINTGIFSNYDKIEFMLVPNYLSIVNPWNRIAGNCNQIVIPKCDLFLLPCSSVKLNLILIKNEEKIVSGKKFKFENRLSIVKIVNVTL